METVNFKIGDGFGITLMNIAQEHLLYSHNPQKAMDTITKSLQGCPEDLALKILIGEMVLPVDEETQQVICVPREDFHDTIFPSIDLKDWLWRQSRQIESGGESLCEQLDIARREALRSSGYYNFNFNYKSIFEFLKGNNDPVLQELIEDEELTQLGDLIRVTKNYLETASKIKAIFEWASKAYPELGVKYNDHGAMMDVMSALSNLLNVREVDTELESIRDDALTMYIQNVKDIDTVLSEGIKPVDIMDNYSAGWLSPEGMYYALNGDIANMLHNQIATALSEAGIIECTDENPDVWLEQNGWVKVHENNVQFGGNLNDKIGEENVYITKVQKEMLINYITDCHQCKVLLGWKRQPYSVGMFGAMDRIALHKHFEF